MGRPVGNSCLRPCIPGLSSLGCLLLSSFSFALSASSMPNGARSEASVPNVILVYLDDIGTEFYGLYDSVNAYGPGVDPFNNGIYVQTPVLDGLAERGIVFTSAYATPLCSPGRAALLTGLSPVNSGVGTLIRHDFVGGLSEFGDLGYQSTTLADLIHRLDGEAGIIGKWHLSLPDLSMDPVNGNPKFRGWRGIAERGGWDDVRCTFANLNSTSMPNGQPGGMANYIWYDNGVVKHETSVYATTHQMSEALDFCRNAAEPFIAYIAPNAVHYPLDHLPGPELVNTPAYLQGNVSKVKECQAALEAVDTELGRLLRGIQSERRERTIVVVMGDNGTDRPVMFSLMQEYGPLGQTYTSLITSPFQRFKHSIYEGGIRVPMVVSWAGIDQPGRVSDALVHVSDLFPTIAGMWSLDPGNVDGVSFLPLLEDANVTAASHARQDLRIDMFARNGAIEHAHQRRKVAYTRRVNDGRRFKLVRHYGLPDNGSVTDSFFLLSDSAGNWVDAHELDALELSPGAPYWNEYLECADAIAPEERWNYCEARPNSTGLPALMNSSGEASVSTNSLVLEASPVPATTLGFFRYSSRAAEIPFLHGVLCLSDQGFGPFQLPFVESNAQGVLSHALNVEAPPEPAARICAGSTWRFQGYFRDQGPNGGAFCMTDGLAIRWTP